MITSHTLYRPRAFGTHADRRHHTVFVLDADDAVAEVDRTAARGNSASYLFPHLPRPVFGIQKPLDQAGFGALLTRVCGRTKRALERIAYRLCDRQAFNALRAPLRRYFVAGHTPNFFGVVL